VWKNKFQELINNIFDDFLKEKRCYFTRTLAKDKVI